MRRHAFFLGALALIGLALRVRGLAWGLPWTLHIDERLFVCAKAIRLERSLESGGLPDPGITSYGILPLWLLVLARRLFLHVAAGTGPPAYGDEFAATALLARWISALAGALAVVFTGLWARRFGPATSLVAAAMVAGFPALVQAGHFGTVESLLVAAIAAGMLWAERLAERPTWGRAARAGLLLGIATSVKAPGAVLALPIAHAAWGERVGRGARLALIALVAAAVVFVVNPTLLLGGSAGADTGEHTTLAGNLHRAFSRDFHDWTLPYAHDVPVLTEARKLLPYAAGVLPEALALVGLAALFRRRAARDVRLLLVAAPLLLLLFAAHLKTVRFLVPALPALAVLAAEGLAALTARLAPPARATLAAAVSAAVILQGAAFTAIYAAPDARVAAARWLDDHVGPREVVGIEDPPGYGPPIGSPTPLLTRPPMNVEILWRGFYQIHEHLEESERRRRLQDVLDRSDWLALSEGHRAEFTAAPELRPVEAAFYRDLDAGRLAFEKVAEFKSYPALGRWSWKDDGAEVLFRVFDHPRVEIWRKRK